MYFYSVLDVERSRRVMLAPMKNMSDIDSDTECKMDTSLNREKVEQTTVTIEDKTNNTQINTSQTYATTIGDDHLTNTQTEAELDIITVKTNECQIQTDNGAIEIDDPVDVNGLASAIFKGENWNMDIDFKANETKEDFSQIFEKGGVDSGEESSEGDNMEKETMEIFGLIEELPHGLGSSDGDIDDETESDSLETMVQEENTYPALLFGMNTPIQSAGQIYI